MHKPRLTRLVIAGCVTLLQTGALVAGAESSRIGGDIARDITFRLSFLHSDMTWLGDPASPTAQLFLASTAQPIATDVCVRTQTTRIQPVQRRVMHECRIAEQEGQRTVYAFTPQREKVIGIVDAKGQFQPNDFYRQQRGLLPTWPDDPSVLRYDPEANQLYYEVPVAGPVVSEQLDHLPLDLVDASQTPIGGGYSITFQSPLADRPAVVALLLDSNGTSLEIARAEVPQAFARGDVQLGSYDNAQGTYASEDAYRTADRQSKDAPLSVTITIPGKFSESVDSASAQLTLQSKQRSAGEKPRPQIAIDGNFDDWRNVPGIDDPRGDGAPYLEYIPDVDLLEFKLANDDEHIYFYARVAGQVGRTHPQGGRAYFYAYMDVDQNPGTGFLPSRDDDCYYGVDVGDDCEVQFEYVDNAFRKTFYGFCGLGGNENVLKQQVTLGKSQYGRIDEQGRQRQDYKAEYTFRDGKTEITEDLKLGTSDTIRLAVSPDGSQVEVVSSLRGFLKDSQGRPTVKLGQTIDVAAGMESDSKLYPGKKHWGADSTTAIRGYRLEPQK